MKKLIGVIALLTLLVVSNVQAQNWSELYRDGNSTKVGAVYAVVCNVCNDHGRYNNDAGMWRCTNDSIRPSPVYRDCKQALIDAVTGNYTGE